MLYWLKIYSIQINYQSWKIQDLERARQVKLTSLDPNSRRIFGKHQVWTLVLKAFFGPKSNNSKLTKSYQRFNQIQ